MAKYSLEIKLAAVHAYLNGVESFKTTAEKYCVNISQLKQWVALSNETISTRTERTRNYPKHVA
jgi:transposase